MTVISSAAENILLFTKTYTSCWPQYVENPSKCDSSLALNSVF